MRYILKIIRPKLIPNHKTDWDWTLRFYYWIIRTLLPLYKRCAISDSIILGGTQIIHNVRDYWYEQELQRFHLDNTFSIEKKSIPYSIKRKFKLSRLFCWSDSLLILHEGGSYSIKRDKDVLVDTDIEGLFKLSTEKDFVSRSEFAGKVTSPQQGQTNNNQILNKHTDTSDKLKSSSKIVIKDTAPVDNTRSQYSPELVKHQGFEENNLF